MFGTDEADNYLCNGSMRNPDQESSTHDARTFLSIIFMYIVPDNKVETINNLKFDYLSHSDKCQRNMIKVV